MDRTLSVATTPGQSGPGSDGNEGVLRILQNLDITETSPSDRFVSYLEHSLVVGSFTSLQRRSRCILQLTGQPEQRKFFMKESNQN